MKKIDWKKILEILQYGDTDIRFRTDLKPADKPDTIPGLVSSLAFAMMTTLWGANERDIIPVLRALTIADLAVSVNREEMIRLMDQDSKVFADILQESRREFERQGGKVISFPPFVQPSKTRS